MNECKRKMLMGVGFKNKVQTLLRSSSLTSHGEDGCRTKGLYIREITLK